MRWHWSTLCIEAAYFVGKTRSAMISATTWIPRSFQCGSPVSDIPFLQHDVFDSGGAKQPIDSDSLSVRHWVHYQVHIDPILKPTKAVFPQSCSSCSPVLGPGMPGLETLPSSPRKFTGGAGRKGSGTAGTKTGRRRMVNVGRDRKALVEVEQGI